jgi:nucleoid DNA-binding protein
MPKYDRRTITLQESYKWYLANSDDEYKVDYKQFKLILETWGKCLNKRLCLGQDVRLYRGFSMLGVRKKIQRTYIDRQESKRQGKKVVLPNSHSNYYRASIYWKKHYTKFSCKGWSFKPTRELRKQLHDVMVEPGGHRRFVQRAMVTRSKESAKRMYNHKIYK